MYRSKQFSIRKDIEEIKNDIKKARAFYGDKVEKIFFEDGNAFVVKPEVLLELTNYSYEIHPNLRKVSAYAHAKDIISKSDEDLKILADAGFTMVYVGIESGDDEVLKDCNKGALLGLAGSDSEKSRNHAIESAKLINRMAPPNPINWYISPLTLRITPGSELWSQKAKGEFHPCSSTLILEELYTMIEYTSDDLQKCIFNSNHASNYLGLKGELARDKKKFLKMIEYSIKHPEVRRPDYLRGL
jgi:radical SAM superfamily enzyme YgiQ (UPF0313 family)